MVAKRAWAFLAHTGLFPPRSAEQFIFWWRTHIGFTGDSLWWHEQLTNEIALLAGRKAEIAEYMMDTFWFLDNQNMHWQRSGSLLDCKLLGWGGKGTLWNELYTKSTSSKYEMWKHKLTLMTAMKRFRILGFADLTYLPENPSILLWCHRWGVGIRWAITFTEFFNMSPLYWWIFPEKISKWKSAPSVLYPKFRSLSEPSLLMIDF